MQSSRRPCSRLSHTNHRTMNRPSKPIARNPATRDGCCGKPEAEPELPMRSPHPQQTDPPTRLARAGAATKRMGEARPTYLGSREELVRRRGGGGGGVAPATAVPVHPLLVALQREAPQLPQRRLHVLAPRTQVRAGARSSPRSPAAGRRPAMGSRKP
jgi:hypothetical protein